MPLIQADYTVVIVCLVTSVITNIERLKKIQNQAAIILTRSTQRNYITPVLGICIGYSFNGSAPEYLCDLITKQNASVRTRCPEDCSLLRVPLVSKFCANMFCIGHLFMQLIPYGTSSVKIQECYTLSSSKVVSRLSCT